MPKGKGFGGRGGKDLWQQRKRAEKEQKMRKKRARKRAKKQQTGTTQKPPKKFSDKQLQFLFREANLNRTVEVVRGGEVRLYNLLRLVETPFASMPDAILKEIANEAGEIWGRGTLGVRDLTSKAQSAKEIWETLYNEWRRRHPDANPMKFR